MGGGGAQKLRQIPTQVIKEASHLFSGVIPKPRQVHTPAKLRWMPVYDGVVLPADSDCRTLRSMPLLLGYTRNESRYFIKAGMLPDSRLVRHAVTKVLAGTQTKAVLKELTAEGGSIYDQVDHVYTDAIWAEPTLTTLRVDASAMGRLCSRWGSSDDPSAKIGAY